MNNLELINYEKAVIELNKHADTCFVCGFCRKCNTTDDCCEEGRRILKLIADSYNGNTPA